MKTLISLMVDTDREGAAEVYACVAGAGEAVISAGSFDEALALIPEAIQQAEAKQTDFEANYAQPEKDPEHYLIASVSVETARAELERMAASERTMRKIWAIEKAEAFTQKQKSGMDLETGRYLMMLGCADVNGAVNAFCKSYALGFQRGFNKAKKERRNKEVR